MNEITGKTAVCGLVGNPVSHTLSPFVQNTLASLMGLNRVYAAFPVRESIEKAVAGAHALGILGLNVTYPYKRDVMPFLCGIDENALQIGAVNTLKYTENGYYGYNTDVLGVLRTFEKYNISLKEQNLLILGAGGGARACAFAGAAHGARRIFIANRTNNNAELLATNIKKYYNNIEAKSIGLNESAALTGDYFIVQATNVGMDSADSPVADLSVIEKSAGVLDIIYSPLKTKILQDAQSFGKLSVNGLDMLVYQAVAAFELWNDIKVGEECASGLYRSLTEYLIG